MLVVNGHSIGILAIDGAEDVKLLGGQDTRLDRDTWSYVRLVEVLRRISSHPEEDALEPFRRMCFNALSSNTDNHPRNHAVIAHGAHWRLSLPVI